MSASVITRCACGHLKSQHGILLYNCDNCKCRRFTVDVGELDLPDDLKGDLCVTPEAAQPSHNEEVEKSEPVGSNRGSTDFSPVARVMSGLKDSGQRLQFESGMVRDIEDNKPAFHFMIPKDVPMDKQMLTRVAEHLRKGAKKYSARNWEKGNSDEEAERARESALRHMMQYIMGETDEDHAAAVITNLVFAETMQYKANQKKEGK